MSFRLELNLNVCTCVPQKLCGYLYSGHTKAAQRDKGCIKELHGFAQRDKGRIIIRLDPTRQSNEFVEIWMHVVLKENCSWVHSLKAKFSGKPFSLEN